MNKDYITDVSGEIESLTKTKEFYKKQYWQKSRSLDTKKRIITKKLFLKVDRLNSHLKLWLKHLVQNKPSNKDSYITLIERGKSEMNSSFKQLNKILYEA